MVVSSIAMESSILPGWTLVIPEPTHGVVREQDGARWYVVKRGDTLSGIGPSLLGDEKRYRDIFDLNVGQAHLGNRSVLRSRI